MYVVPIGEILNDLAIAERKENFKRIESVVCGLLKKINANKSKIIDPFLSSVFYSICCGANANSFLNYDSVLEVVQEKTGIFHRIKTWYI